MCPVTEINYSLEQLVLRIHDHFYQINDEDVTYIRCEQYFAEIDENYKLFAEHYEHTRALISNFEKQLEHESQNESIKFQLNKIKPQID